MDSKVVTRSAAQKAKIQTRAKTGAKTKQSLALQEAKKKAKLKMSDKKDDVVLIKDIYHSAMASINLVRKNTGLIYDRRMAQHLCLWDKNYPECPERFTRILERCEQLNLTDRCVTIDPRSGTMEEVLMKHTKEQYDLLKSTSGSTDEASLEDLSSHYDAIYIHPTTFDLSLLAVGSTIELVDNILMNKVQNGMAIIRPPGHHAMKAEYNGYCFFNNVAIAAEHALQKRNLKKILIVDWDVHHGQGIQRMFYNDPRVLYFSIHRYEHGTFWPNLRESEFDFIGDNEGKGYNFNLPLNKTGMTNADYLAIFQQILLPVAVEFQPELIIISAGYDAAFGCPEGQMEITPACYSHLLSPLMTLAQGKVAVVLEGGYCLQSLAEGAALTLKTLLGDPCPIMESLEPPCDSIQETILNCIHVHKPYWKNLQLQKTYSLEELNNINPQPNLHKVVSIFKGGPPVPERFATRNCYPIQSETFSRNVVERLNYLELFTNLYVAQNRVCYVYDDLMLLHENSHEEGHPERPDRILKIKQRLEEYKLFARMKSIKSRIATTDELCMVHSLQHVELMKNTVEKEELKEIGDTYNSVYFHPKTFECAALAAGSVLQVVDEILNGLSRSGVCIVRPPGHHAESDLPHGFCIFNNIAIAAQYAIANHGLKRILIIDWDVHFGNGTQHIFESNPNVLYVSLHRYDYGNFFPKSKDADYTEVGSGRGKGFNVNIPWNKKGMGDMEYIAAFQTIIMPIAYEFNPELVLVSAGFDAAIGDPLGGCKVTPEAYGYFTHWLSALANGKIIVCLEGGYNVNSISYAMTMCTKTLLGDPLPVLHHTYKTGPNQSCIETIRNVLSIQENYWKCLKFNKKLPAFSSDSVKSESCVEELMSSMSLSSSCNDADADSNNSTNKEKKESNLEESQQCSSKSTTESSNKTLTDYLAEHAQALANEEMFAVVPLKNCPHLSMLDSSKAPSSIKTNSPCEECDSTIENWICLECFRILCGRYVMEHMLYHHLSSEHPLTLSFSDLSVWCYKCEAYIDNPCLFKYKNLAHLDKFGEEMTWSYGSDTMFLDNPSTSSSKY